jgi:hypothetical protein
MRMVRSAPLVLLVLFLLIAGGCDSSGGAKVSGEVKLDGGPLEKGEITFTPTDGKGQAAGGAIVAGKYSVAGVPPGPNHVQIRAFKPGPKKQEYKDDPKSERETWANVKFTTDSKMEIDIKSGGNDLPPFELKSKP